MAQVSDSRPTSSAQSSAQSNIQDVFLNHARRDRLVVALQLMDGRRLDAVIKSFDRFAVIVEIDEMSRTDFDNPQLEALLGRVRGIFGVGADSPFGSRYLPLLQRDVDAAIAHAAIRQILSRLDG
jgi:RNA chaperone Hfq